MFIYFFTVTYIYIIMYIKRMSVNAVHLAQACVGSAPGERGPLQLAEHPGDAAPVLQA